MTIVRRRRAPRRRIGPQRAHLRGPDAAAARPARRGLPSRARRRRPHGRPGRLRRCTSPAAARSRSSRTAPSSWTSTASATQLHRGRHRHLRRRPAAPLREPWPAPRPSCSPSSARASDGAERDHRHVRPTTLFDKIWAAHEVADGLIYIDLHLVHEVTSPQAFDGLRLAGRPVRRPDRTLATADHNVPTDGTPVAARIKDELSRIQVETLERNCAEFGDPGLLARLRAPGHRARDRAGARPHPAGHDDRLRRLPHRHARRVRRARVRHRHERGRARPGHADAGPAQAEVDADQLRGRAWARASPPRT